MPTLSSKNPWPIFQNSSEYLLLEIKVQNVSSQCSVHKFVCHDRAKKSVQTLPGTEKKHHINLPIYNIRFKVQEKKLEPGFKQKILT